MQAVVSTLRQEKGLINNILETGNTIQIIIYIQEKMIEIHKQTYKSI